MDWSEIVFGSLLVAVLLLLSSYFGWRQWVVLRRLRAETLPSEESRYERRMAYRRLVSCGLTLLLGLLLASALSLFDPDFMKIPATELPSDQRLMLRVWGGSWVAILLLLLVVVGIAAVDLWSTRRHALQQFRKLQADRRAMIQRQSMRLREERDQQK